MNISIIFAYFKVGQTLWCLHRLKEIMRSHHEKLRQLCDKELISLFIVFTAFTYVLACKKLLELTDYLCNQCLASETEVVQ